MRTASGSSRCSGRWVTGSIPRGWPEWPRRIGSLSGMADQSTQTIVIDAPPAAILAVIADFENYPEWAASVKRTEVTEAGAGGRARRVAFWRDAGVVRDQYELSY